MPKKFSVLFFLTAVIFLACGQEIDCPTGIDVNLPPDGALRDESLAIHRLAVWENGDHQTTINSASTGTHDFCITMNDPAIDRVAIAYGQLLTSDRRLKYTMELEIVPDLVGVYCRLFRVDGRDWSDAEVAIFRGWVIGIDGNWNYRDAQFIINVP